MGGKGETWLCGGSRGLGFTTYGLVYWGTAGESVLVLDQSARPLPPPPPLLTHGKASSAVHQIICPSPELLPRLSCIPFSNLFDVQSRYLGTGITRRASIYTRWPGDETMPAV